MTGLQFLCVWVLLGCIYILIKMLEYGVWGYLEWCNGYSKGLMQTMGISNPSVVRLYAVSFFLIGLVIGPLFLPLRAAKWFNAKVSRG